MRPAESISTKARSGAVEPGRNVKSLTPLWRSPPERAGRSASSGEGGQVSLTLNPPHDIVAPRSGGANPGNERSIVVGDNADHFIQTNLI